MQRFNALLLVDEGILLVKFNSVSIIYCVFEKIFIAFSTMYSMYIHDRLIAVVKVISLSTIISRWSVEELRREKNPIKAKCKGLE
jgi:multidrug transporter EmrE-like cation transporter